MTIKKILEHNVRVYVIATGAGAGFQKRLWNIPGCSSFLVGAQFPYEFEKTIALLGFTPDRFVSAETSIELAMKAYMEAYNPAKKCDDVIGIGLTASVASTKEHRGDHRIIVTIISNKGCSTISAVIQKGVGEIHREEDGKIADELAEVILCQALDIPPPYSREVAQNVLSMKTTYHLDENLINLIMKRPYLKADGTRDFWSQPMIESHSHHNGDTTITNIPSPYLLFAPGTYNPFHYGHEGAAKAAQNIRINDKCQNINLIYTTCINPVHKPTTKAVDLLQKISQMKGRNFLLTKDDGLFIDKARANSNAGFVLGADALLTMLDPKWYKDLNDIDKMLEEFDDLNVKFYIVGRLVNDKFITLKDIQESHPFIRNHCFLFCQVPGRWDISSTELRNKKNAM